MGFIPMYLSQTDMTTGKFDPGFTLEFSPMGVAKQALKILQFSNTVTYGDGLNLDNLSDYFEIHRGSVMTFYRFSSKVEGQEGAHPILGWLRCPSQFSRSPSVWDKFASTLSGLIASGFTQGRRFAPTLGCMIPTPSGLEKKCDGHRSAATSKKNHPNLGWWRWPSQFSPSTGGCAQRW